MITGLFAAGLLAMFVGLSNRTPEVDNTNTQYCVAAPTRSNLKQEQTVTATQNCSKGTITTEPTKSSLSERKSK